MDGQADLERALAVADHELYLAKSEHTGDETALEDERLLDFARQLKRLQNSEEVLGQGLQMTRRLANFEVAAYIVVKGHEYQVQHVDAGLGVDPEILKREGPRLLSGLILETFQQRSAIVSVDFPHDPCTDHAAKARGIKTAILTPVDQGGEIVGLLALFNFSHHQVVSKRTQRAVELAALRMGYALELLLTVQSVRQTLEGGLLNLGVALEDHDLETQGHTPPVVELSTQSGAEPGLIPEGMDDLR